MTLRKKFAAAALAISPMLLLSACSKPSEAEVKTGLVKIFTKSGLDQATAEKVADCAAPKAVDQLSKSTLDNYADGEDLTQADEKDEATKIITDCATSVTGS